MKIFAFAGLPSAGKTFHAERLSEEFNIPLVETGQILYDEVKKKGLPITESNIKRVWRKLKRKDKAILTRLAIKKIKEEYKNKEATLFLSPKCLKEVELLRNSFEKVYVVAFVAPPNTRYRRAVELKYRYTRSITEEKRKEIASVDTIQKFKEHRDNHELRLGVGKVLALADHYINTNKTQEEAEFEVKRLFWRLLK